MVAQEQRPLTRIVDRGRLLPYVGYRKAILHPHRHKEARHQRKMERHVAFLAALEVRDCVLRPLIGLTKQHPVAELLVDVSAQLFQERVRFRQVLAIGALAFAKVWHRVEPEPVDAHPEPEIEDPVDGLAYLRIVEIQIRLM